LPAYPNAELQKNSGGMDIPPIHYRKSVQKSTLFRTPRHFTVLSGVEKRI
jgi:hypothetical protein